MFKWHNVFSNKVYFKKPVYWDVILNYIKGKSLRILKGFCFLKTSVFVLTIANPFLGYLVDTHLCSSVSFCTSSLTVKMV